MMAAEATSEKPVDVSVTDASLLQTTASTESQPQDVQAPSPPTVNGTGAHDEPERTKVVNDIVDEIINSAEVSVSGGSDTETSITKRKDGSNAPNSSTLKKPQTFKSVSVNRTFLGAKNAANATSRSETSSPSLTPAAPVIAPGSSASKLKLVAKSGSNLGGSTKTLTTNGKGPGVPDGGTVWNRNRPTPTPETKKFSDEELKRYGIHMADRLRPENQNGQSNWADDEDEEWQPEQITWTDGTRITLDNQPTPNPVPAVPVPTTSITNVPVPPPTNVPVPPVANVPALSVTNMPIPSDKPKSPAPSLTSGNARASPAVKPSFVASSSSGKSLVLKGVPEKPTLVAKAPAPPTPVKSPWASLPPVERAPPVLMDLPGHQQPAPPMRGYPPHDPSLGLSSVPAKEIAADDFTRSPWRDGSAGGSRELYNSQSGRYEPVHDRRGSRHDINHRHPALLQRPMHQHDQSGQAEPSAAFQTSRNSGQDGLPYGRRRNSSNVSGGSGGITHRLAKPHDMPPPEHNLPATSQASPSRSQHAQPWLSRSSPGQTSAVPQAIPPTVAPTTDVQIDTVGAAIPSEDDVELQKRLMRERREMAIKRRLEEEAKEEAARKERIALKLAAMGPAPERKSTKKDEPKDAVYKRDGPPAGIFSKEDLAAAAAERTIAPPVSSPKKQEILPATIESKPNGTSPAAHQAGKSQDDTTRVGPPPASQPAAPWPESARKSNERLPSWGAGPQSGPKNVWAAPGNDRSLGNGTFDADLGQLANSEPTQPASMTSRPTPIGPPRSTSQGQSQRHEQQHGRLAPIGPPGSGRPGAPSIHSSNVRSRNPWATADIAADDRAIRAEKQKQAEEYRKNLESQGMNTNELHHGVNETWRGVNVRHDGKRLAGDVVTSHHGERLDRTAAPTWEAPPPGPHHESARPDAHPVHQQPLHHQDFRASHGSHDVLYGRAPPIGTASIAPPGPPMAQPRAGSRFFPHHGSRDIRQEEIQELPRSKSPTPPPPTMDGHPAYDGDVAHPHVSLPPTRPVVKLPPAVTKQPQLPKQAPAPIAPPKPVSFAAAAAAAAAATAPASRSTMAALAPGRGVNYGGTLQTAGEIKKQENWQEKINSLVRAAPVKPMSVDSSSKYAFDAHANTSATVSLPALSPTGSSSSETSSVISKEMAEECFDEQEMGSLPLINLPHDAPSALWSSKAVEPNWQPLQREYHIDALGSESVRFPHEIVNHKSVLRILTPGMTEPRTVLAPFTPRNRSNPRRQGRGGRGSRGGQRGGRDLFGDHQKSPIGTDRSERPDRISSRGGGRTPFRARSENWSRNSSLAQPTQS